MKTTPIRMIGFLVLGLMGTALVHASPEGVKLATVDMQRALQSVEAGKRAKSDLEKDSADRTSKLKNEEAAIKKMGEELRKQSLVMSDEAKAKKQAEFQERVMKFQEAVQKNQMEFRQKEAQFTQPIIEKLRGVISEIAKDKGYSMVLERNENTVLYSQEKDDLTSEVIATFNKKHKSK